jgi:hypothetical protein
MWAQIPTSLRLDLCFYGVRVARSLVLTMRFAHAFQVFGDVRCLYMLKRSDRDICAVTCVQTSHYYATRPNDSAQIKGLVRLLAPPKSFFSAHPIGGSHICNRHDPPSPGADDWYGYVEP